MKVTRKVVQPVEVIEDIFCNFCGLSCKSPMGEFYGLIEVEVVAGYESTHLEDGEVHKFSLCERCLSEMIIKFKYPSFQGNFMVPENETSKEYSEDFDPKEYWEDKIISLDELDPDEIVTALNLDEPLLGDNLYREDAGLLYDIDDDDECFAGSPNTPILQEEDMTDEERASIQDLRDRFGSFRKKKEDLN